MQSHSKPTGARPRGRRRCCCGCSGLLLRWRRGELLLRCGKMLLRVQVLLLLGELILERADFAAQLVILANAC